MTETPDERRERIDAARREQAELNREIGQEFANLAIRPSAAQAWKAFQTALTVGEQRYPPVRPKCFEHEDRYRNYDAFNVPSPAKAKMLCHGCPLFAECDEFGKAERPGWGIWGGMVYGKDIADKERREAVKTQHGYTITKEEAID